MNKVYKTILSVTAAAIVAGATITPTLVNAWGDSNNGRPSYTISQIEEGKLGDTITFNSISNGKIGDEKNFVGAKVGSSSSNVWNADEIQVKDGETYTVRLYVHNNSPKGLEAVAKDVTAQISLPTTVGKTQTIIGYLNSSNAAPTRYWDEVKFVSSEDFYVEYVKGSAKYTNAKMGTVALSDNVIIGGAKLGYDSLNGEIPGCFEYDGVVTIEVKAHKSVSAKLAKTVRIKGSGDKFAESVEAKVGDEVEFQIEYVNLLGSKVDDVMIRDVLPTNMEYVADSTYLYNSNYQSGVLLKDNTVTTSGINIGSYNAKGNAYVRFTAKVVDNDLKCESSNQLVNWASATVSGRVVKDDASVMVEGGICEEGETPTPTPETTPGETPGTIVRTGAGEIAGTVLGAGSLTTALGYYIASRKKLM
ncbi:MAG: hypothetical protein Q4B29_00940 [Candidatus Saccharibacteria bacterium]|nr:hypothetical protein [Candidatus Saccharibacteria bacterium]